MYIDLRITDTKKGRIPTGLEKKNSIAVQTASAIQRRTENNGESVPGKGRKGNVNPFGKSVMCQETNPSKAWFLGQFTYQSE